MNTRGMQQGATALAIIHMQLRLPTGREAANGRGFEIPPLVMAPRAPSAREQLFLPTEGWQTQPPSVALIFLLQTTPGFPSHYEGESMKRNKEPKERGGHSSTIHSVHPSVEERNEGWPF